MTSRLPLKRPFRTFPALLSVALAALAWGCRSNGDSGGSGPSALHLVQGAGQQTQVGTAVTIVPVVRLFDGSGNALSGVVVRFTVTSGGGSVIGDSVATDPSGDARPGSWIVGTVPGTNILEASVTGTSVRIDITAAGVAGAASAVRPTTPVGYAALTGSTVTPPPAVQVFDAFGNPVVGATVTFRVTRGTITGATQRTNATGIATLGSWTLPATAGPDSLIASIGLSATAVFVAQVLTATPTLAAISPTTQSSFLDAQVTQIPRVQVKDASGRVLSGVPVTFTVSAGDGVVTGGSAVSDSAGIAAPADWRMGATLVTSVIATSALGATPLTFTATGVLPNFIIEVRFLSAVTPDVRDAFITGAHRWMRIIATHLAAVPVSLPAGACTAKQPAVNEQIADLVIFADVSPIDGVGNVLGMSSPCASRTTGGLTVVGTMQFDSADLNVLVATGQLVPTITHEICHVLGFGTLWAEKNLATGLGSSDPIFIGAQALAAWPPFAAALSYNGRPIPLENTGGAGTAGAHWRESVFDAELMTGFIEAPGVAMPISKVTVASLIDLGYNADLSQADLFVGNLRAGGPAPAPATQLRETLGAVRFRIGNDGSVTPTFH